MKAFITPAYTFTPGLSGVGTVNLSGISGFNIKNLVAIINQTAGKLIYSTGNEALRYTALASTTLTLNFDTSSMLAGDVLQVVYEQSSLDPLTDTQLRATAVPVSGPLTDTQIRATALPVSGPITDAQIRATALPVSGPLTDAQLRATSLTVIQTVLSASYAESLVVDTAGVTITAPVGAKWCKVQADGSNAANLRMKIGAIATTTSGIILEPGRSEDFSAAGNISVFAESGTGQKVYVQFGA